MSDQVLKVELADPSSGWLGFEISTPEAQIGDVASYTPNDFLLELTTALFLSLQKVEAVAIASCEPTTYEFTLSPALQGDVLNLQITKYANSKRNRDKGVAVLSVSACPRDIVLPFWKALRNLEGRISSEDYSKAFQREFPTSCLQRLSQMVAAQRHE